MVGDLVNTAFKAIINPAAGNGAGGRKWPGTRDRLRAVLGKVSEAPTEKSGDATRLTTQALHDGFETIIAVGGDGTINEVVNGFFQNGRPINPDASLAVLPMGTGSDLARTLRQPKDPAELAQRWLRKPSRCDLGLTRCTSAGGRETKRYFINVADAGFGATVAAAVNRSSKALGAFASYMTALLRTLVSYKTSDLIIRLDNNVRKTQPVFSVAVANGQFFGGGLWIAPHAKMNDGIFEVVVIGDASPYEVIANIHKLYGGTAETHPKIDCYQARSVALDSEKATLLETDGEQPGFLPASFEIVPDAINIRY